MATLTSTEPGLRDFAKLKGTSFRPFSQIARFARSARVLGPARVTQKIFQRALKQFAKPKRTQQHPSNLDALHRCSWVAERPELTVIDSEVTTQDLLNFQAEMNYPHYYYFAERRIRYSLWHHVGVRLGEFERSSTVIDVGAQAGLWGAMIRRRFGCRVYDLDLEYRPGVHGYRIGAPAGSIPLPDQSMTRVVTFCAFNCFEGDDDTAMIKESARLLVPGGKLIIVPLCIGDEYVNLYDPTLIGQVDRLDPGARPAALSGWGNSFGRWYDQAAFDSRILRHAGDFDVEIHRIRHPFDCHEHFEAMYAARLVRRS